MSGGQPLRDRGNIEDRIKASWGCTLKETFDELEKTRGQGLFDQIKFRHLKLLISYAEGTPGAFLKAMERLDEAARAREAQRVHRRHRRQNPADLLSQDIETAVLRLNARPPPPPSLLAALSAPSDPARIETAPALPSPSVSNPAMRRVRISVPPSRVAALHAQRLTAAAAVTASVPPAPAQTPRRVAPVVPAVPALPVLRLPYRLFSRGAAAAAAATTTTTTAAAATPVPTAAGHKRTAEEALTGSGSEGESGEGNRREDGDLMMNDIYASSTSHLRVMSLYRNTE
ncbi:uncharacterized protein K452DRAFT_341845 [Aplosporella prunicola CBS 121167]|uniref:Uncharacterized protein n=1 Tax=Aplosporella prunicola CBS 121167 TaxID=1176127 RepID=A0A6A6AYD5_9PEZI|nr:uncharacterized protein K452DRAFT_341845 [Aplosporella prunicola CBS 121167]KAF2136942.1 hypothetical protein K452DRAFT_341845 [Aplosporella prunicola CBS 121167]